MRRRSDPVSQKLRQLVRSGRRAEVLPFLQSVLRLNPHHAFAREELSRHLSGRPFSFEEKLQAELQRTISDYLSNPASLADATPAQLRQLRQRIRILKHELKQRLTAADLKSLDQFDHGIDREFKRRGAGKRKIAISLTIASMILGLLGITGYYLNQRATAAAAALHNACDCETTSIETALHLLAIHNTGLNRTLNRNVGAGAARLEAHIHAARERSKELDAILHGIETGEQSVTGQGIRGRAEIERKLTLPCVNTEDLQQRWAKLCQLESAALHQQRMTLTEELLSPLPAQEAMHGQAEKDAASLEQYLEKLQQRMLLFEEAGETLGLAADTIIPAQEAHAAATQVLQEIKALQRALMLLPTARDYGSYRSLLAKLTARYYQPAEALLRIIEQMPGESTVQEMMQEHGQNLPPGLLQASRHCLQESGPSFSTDFPATQQQLHLLDELFTNSALNTRFYELTDTAENQQAISEQLPELIYGRACFNRSALDPANPNHLAKREEWHNPHAILSREIDPRPLFTGLGLDDRRAFLLSANLPERLTRVFHIERANIPALARAYVFHYLAQANAAAAEPILSGLRYAPDMRKLIKEFEQLKQECGIELNGTCWLENTPAHHAAEQKFARWFNKNRKCNFSDEIKRNLDTLLRVEPRFCGYVNELGEPVLFEETRQGQLIWYMGSDAGMTATPWGEALQQPMLLSPVFTMEKQN